MDTNEQTIIKLRAALEREVAESRARTEHASVHLNEISRINNELVNTQRELANVAETARQDAEKLKISETRYRRLFESAKDGILIMDAATGQIEDVNPSLCYLLGFEPNDFIGKQLWEIGTFRDIAANQGAFRSLQEQEYVRRDDLSLETKGGKSASVEFVSNVYVSGDKRVVQCNVRDITDRKQVEAAFEALSQKTECRERLLSTALASMSDFAHLYDREGRFLFANQPLLDLWGLTLEAVVGKNFFDLGYPAEMAERLQRQVQEVFESRQRITDETPYTSPTGTEGYYEYVFSPAFDPDGTVGFVVGTTRDITDRKRSEAALAASESRYHSLFENMLEGYAYCRTLFEGDELRDVVYLEVNNAFETLTGLQDVVGKKVSEVLPGHQEANRELFELYRRVVLSGKAQKCETYLEHLDIWLSIAVYSSEREHFVAVFDNITQRKQAEHALLSGEQEQREIAERLEHERAQLAEAQAVAKLGSWELDLSTNALTWSDENYRIFGVDRDKLDIAYDTFLSLIHPDDRAVVEKTYTASVANRKPYEIDHRLQMKDGSLRIVHERCQTFYDEAGQPLRSVGTTQDITEHWLADEALQESQAELRAVIQSLDDIVFEFDEQGTYVNIWCNDETLLVRPKQELIGRRAADVLGQILAEPFVAAFGRVLGSGRTEDMEYELETVGGRRCFLASISPIPGVQGASQTVSMLSRDITERKQAEKLLQRQQAELRVLFDLMPAMIWFKDTKNNHLRVNQRVAEAAGKPVEEIEGKPAAEIYPEEAASYYADDLEVIRSGVPKLGIVEMLRNRDGEEHWIQTDKVPFRDADGKVIGIVVMGQDITERKQAEAQLHFQKALMEAQTEASLDGILVVAEDRKVLSYNQRFLEMWEIPPQVIASGKDAPLIQSVLDKIADSQKFAEKVEYLYVHPDDRSHDEIALLDGRVFDRYSAPISSANKSSYGRVWYFRDITERKQAAEALRKANEELESRVRERTAALENSNRKLRDNEVRLLEANTIFTRLTRLRASKAEELKTALQQVTEVTSHVLDAERCSVWLYNEDRSGIECLDLYETATAKHSHGVELAFQDFPAYFGALESERSIVADDAHTHSATHEFSEPYLKPLGINSMLDTAIMVGGEMTGVLCCERTGVSRPWTADDQTFSSSASATCALTLESYERARAETELQRSREELQSLIDAMSTLAAKVAPDGTFLIINKVAVDASGLSLEEYMKTNFLTGPWWSFDSEVQKRVSEKFGQALTGTSIHYDEKICLFGQVRTINFSLIPMYDTAGKVEFLIAEGRDITELKQTEAALQQAKAQADTANAAKSEFLSRMSHELRTPLNAILGFGQLLEMGELPPKKRENVQHILKGGRHLLDLINEVLDISRIEVGHLALSLEPVPVDLTVREVLDLVRPLTAVGNVQLINEIPPHSDWCMLADRQRLKQTLLKLFANAVKYNRDGGSVTVLAEEILGEEVSGKVIAGKAVGQRRVLRLLIRDTGNGLSSDEIGKLFVPFERLSAARTRIEGTGIGLALSKRLVEAMNGKIGVWSTPGQGSTFWIELPLVPNPLQSALEQPETSALQSVITPEGERKTVLYIEDNLANLQLIETLLEERPHVRLLTAMQASTGLDLAFEHSPDLILLDLHLPDINGDEVLRRLRADARTRSTPVVMISADATPVQIERLLATGAKTYLTKPLNVKEFLSVLDESLKGKK